MKKIISIALALVMVLSVAVVAVSAAEVNDSNVGADSNSAAGADTSSATTGSGKVINFNSGNWKNFQEVYCHIWERGKDAFYSWQGKKEMCTGSGKNWQYDVSGINLKSGTDYCIIFSTNIGQQTYDITFGTKCIGDTLRITGEKVENPMDSNKKADIARWAKNGSKYGPHLAFTSIGNIVGSVLCPNEKGVEVIGDWLPNYYNSKYIKDHVATLAKGLKKFGITSASQIQDIYAYILNKKTGKDEKEMKKQLEDAFAKAYPAKKSEAKIDEKAAENESKQIASNGGHVSSGGSGSSSGSASSGTSGAGSSGSSYSSSGSSTNSSGSGSDGEEDTIFFVLFGVMLTAAGVMFVTRKKRT